MEELAVPLHVGVVGADVHQAGDGLAGLAHGVALEQLAHLVEQHDEHGLGVLALAEEAGAKGPHRGQGHEEVLVEHLAVGDVADSPPEHVPADDEVGGQKQGEAPKALIGHQYRGDEQHRADGDADEHFFLFACHSGCPFHEKSNGTGKR